MLRLHVRPLTVTDALADAVQQTDGAAALGSSAVARPCTHAYGIPVTQWIDDTLLRGRGVMAAIPTSEAGPGKVVALDKSVASGNSAYWLSNLSKSAKLFNPNKTKQRTPHCATYEAVTLSSQPLTFLPEGRVYGLTTNASTDAFVDAGIKMEIRNQPYSTKCGERQRSLCCMEIALLLTAAERGIAPAVLAVVATPPGPPRVGPQSVPLGDVPKTSGEQRGDREVGSIITVSQLSTFTLDDLMVAIRTAPVQTRRDHLVGVLKSVCAPTFAKIREMSRVSGGYGIVKLNTTPESVVFVPELSESAQGWELHGTGFMPVSDSFVDGTPRIVDFNSMFTTRVRSTSHSTDTAYVAGCLILTAFTRAMHGASVASVLLDTLLTDSRTGFVDAVRAIQSRASNTSSFLSYLAAKSEMRETAEGSKAITGVVSDIDSLLRGVIVNDDGTLGTTDAPVFTKLVALVTGCNDPDTRIFAPVVAEDIDSQRDAIALDAVKLRRLHRLGCAAPRV